MKIRTYANFLFNLFRQIGPILVLSFLVRLSLGMVRGVGLLMVIPLLYVTGILEGSVETGVLSRITESLKAMGLSFGLPSVLICFIGGIAIFAWLKRFSTLLDTRIWQNYVKDLQKEVYRALSFARWSYLLRTKASDIINTLTNDVSIVSLGIRQGLSCLSFLIVGFVNLTVAFFISWEMTLFVALSGAVLWIVLVPLNRKSLERGRSQRTHHLNLLTELTQNMGAIKLIKSSGMEARANDQFGDILEVMHEDALSFQRIKENAQFLYEVLAAVFLSVFIYIALNWGGAEPAVLLMLIYLFVRLIPLVSSFQRSWQLVLNAQPSYLGYQEILQELNANEEPLGEDACKIDLERSIRMESICYSYEEGGEKEVLRDCSFTIPAKKMTIITGSSGIGKTTILDLILGLLSPRAGSIYIDDIELKDGMRHQWREKVAYVPQETYLFQDTIRKNLEWAKPDATEEEMFEALDLFAASFVRELPSSLDTVVGELGKQLSGGECQRIALARAYLSDPQLFVLDEATNALDPECEKVIVSSLKKLSKRMTIIMVTHEAALCQEADLVVKL